MKTTAFANIVGNSLLCTLADADWLFFIRRLDGQTHVPFSMLYKKQISPANIATFIPNWKTLRWVKIKDSILGKHESYAKDVVFEINVYSTEHSPKKHQDVIDAFLEFMRTGLK